MKCEKCGTTDDEMFFYETDTVCAMCKEESGTEGEL
jgi:hypothetical protein